MIISKVNFSLKYAQKKKVFFFFFYNFIPNKFPSIVPMSIWFLFWLNSIDWIEFSIKVSDQISIKLKILKIFNFFNKKEIIKNSVSFFHSKILKILIFSLNEIELFYFKL